MKALKKILIVLVALVAIFLVVSLILPNKMDVEESMVIDASPEVVYNHVVDLPTWTEWSWWHKQDPKMVNTYTGSGVGATNSWESQSQRVGYGKMEIVDAKVGEYINTKLTMFEKSGDSLVVMDAFPAKFVFEKEGEGTKVTWDMHSVVEGNGPLNGVIAAIFKPMIKDAYITGLTDLKDLCENHPKSFKPAVMTKDLTITDLPEMHCMTVKSATDVDGVQAKIGESFGAVMAHMGATQAEGSKMIPQPFCMWHKFDVANNQVEMQCGMFTDKLGKSKDNVVAHTLPAMKVVKGTFFGPYNQLNEGYDALKEHAETMGMVTVGSPWDVYVSDPTTVSDPAKVKTEVYMAVEMK